MVAYTSARVRWMHAVKRGIWQSFTAQGNVPPFAPRVRPGRDGRPQPSRLQALDASDLKHYRCPLTQLLDCVKAIQGPRTVPNVRCSRDGCNEMSFLAHIALFRTMAHDPRTESALVLTPPRDLLKHNRPILKHQRLPLQMIPDGP